MSNIKLNAYLFRNIFYTFFVDNNKQKKKCDTKTSWQSLNSGNLTCVSFQSIKRTVIKFNFYLKRKIVVVYLYKKKTIPYTLHTFKLSKKQTNSNESGFTRKCQKSKLKHRKDF